MTVIYLTEYKCTRYAVSFESDGCVRVQNFEDIPDYEKNILSVKPLRTFLGKSEICEMTKLSGSYGKEIYDGKTILLKISEENDKHRWVYVGGNKICSFLTNDDIYKYISNVGNNITPYSIAVGDEYIYFLTPHFKFIKREMIHNNELLNTNERSVDTYEFHVSRCGQHSFKQIKNYTIHSNYN